MPAEVLDANPWMAGIARLHGEAESLFVRLTQVVAKILNGDA
jgi:hypothetical protein